MYNGSGSNRYAYPDQPGYPQGGYYPPPQPPPPQGGQMDMAAMLIPVLITMPALRNARLNIDTLRNNLNNLPIPPDLTANPTTADFNAMKGLIVNVKNQLLNTVNNDQAAFAALSQGLMLQLIIPAFANGASGNQALMLVVLMMSINGGLGF